MFAFLKVIDCFPVPLSLKYKKINYYRTWTGVFFTLALTGIMMVYLLSLISDLVNRENPNITQASFQLENPSFFQIDNLDFPIMVGLNDFRTATFYINESIYKPHAELVVFQKKEGSTDKDIFNYPIPLEPCTYDFLNKTAISDFFLKVKWDSLYCLRNDLVRNFSIGGAFDQNLFKFLRIYFGACQEDEKTKCAPQEIIQQSLSRGYASLFFMDFVDDFKDHAKPMKPYGRNLFTNFGLNYTKGIDVNFKELIINTDSGLISSDDSTDRYRLYEDSKEFFEPIPTIDRFFYFEFKVGKTRIQFQRQYPKIQDVLSKAGGLINILFLLVSLVLIPFTKVTFYWDLLNECFEMRSQATVEKNDKEDSSILQKPRRMRFYLKDYFLFYFYKMFPGYLRRNKLRKTYTGIFSIEKILDIRNIIKKLHEIDKLKILLLSHEQVSIFNHLPKPRINDESTHLYGSMVYSNKNKNYMEMYEDLKTRSVKSDVDLKLLNMIEKKVQLSLSRRSMKTSNMKIQPDRVKLKDPKF